MSPAFGFQGAWAVVLVFLWKITSINQNYVAEKDAHLCVPLLSRLLDWNPEESDNEKNRTPQDLGKEMDQEIMERRNRKLAVNVSCCANGEMMWHIRRLGERCEPLASTPAEARGPVQS